MDKDGNITYTAIWKKPGEDKPIPTKPTEGGNTVITPTKGRTYVVTDPKIGRSVNVVTPGAKTGDTNNSLIWIVVAVAAAGAGVTAVAVRRRKRD